MSGKRIRAAILALSVGLTLAACSSSHSPGPEPKPSSGSSVPTSSHSAEPSADASTTSPAPASASAVAPVGPAGGPVPAKFIPYSTSFVSAGQGWVLGTAPCATPVCTSVLRTRDGGQTWQGVPAPLAPLGTDGQLGAGAVSTIRFADPADGWVSGRKVFDTHDGGASWQASTLPLGAGQVTGLATAGGRVLASVNSCSDRSPAGCSPLTSVYSSPVGVDRWVRIGPVLAGRQYGPLLATGTSWFLALTSGVYHGVGGASPTRTASPCPDDGVDSANRQPTPYLAAADSRHLDAACGTGGAAGSTSYQLYGSVDAGLHWAKAGPAHREPSGLSGLADNSNGVLLLAAASGGSVILRSTDDGVRLANALLTAPGGGILWNDLGFTTTEQAVAVLSGNGLYLSHDAGRTWARAVF